MCVEYLQDKVKNLSVGVRNFNANAKTKLLSLFALFRLIIGNSKMNSLSECWQEIFDEKFATTKSIKEFYYQDSKQEGEENMESEIIED